MLSPRDRLALGLAGVVGGWVDENDVLSPQDRPALGLAGAVGGWMDKMCSHHGIDLRLG